MPSLKRRLGRLEQRIERPDPQEHAQCDHVRKCRKLIVERFRRLLAAVSLLLTPDEVVRVRAGLAAYFETLDGPFSNWLRNLFTEGCCRLPELDLEVLKGLLLNWLSPDVDSLAVVCAACGLQRPRHKYPPVSQWRLLPGKIPGVSEIPWYDLPTFYQRCPHCGAAAEAATWPRVIQENDYPWKQLDGYAPPYPRRVQLAMFYQAQKEFHRKDAERRAGQSPPSN